MRTVRTRTLDELQLADGPPFTLTEFAALLGVERRTTLNLILNGDVPALRVGTRRGAGEYRIPFKVVRGFVLDAARAVVPGRL